MWPIEQWPAALCAFSAAATRAEYSGTRSRACVANAFDVVQSASVRDEVLPDPRFRQFVRQRLVCLKEFEDSLQVHAVELVN